MAIKTVSIGSAEDIFRFDDGETEYGVETSGKIKADTAPTANDEVVRFQDIPAFGDLVESAANIADNAVVRGDGGAKGIQGSNVTIDDAGSISLLADQTVDGRDISDDGAKLDALLSTIVIYNNTVICHSNEVVTHEV